MAKEKPEEKTFSKQTDRGSGATAQSKLLLLFLSLLVAGTAGYFMYRGLSAGYISAHVGALGLVGLAGIATGAIAGKKGYSYWRAFSLGFAVPILLGLLAVFIFYLPEGVIYCGGSVSLAVALIVLLGCLLVRKKSRDQSFPATDHRG